MKLAWIPERGERLESLKNFVRKPWSEKLLCMKFVCQQVLGVVPSRLPSGDWYLGYDDYPGKDIMGERFEVAERRFTERFLHPGMTVLDIGAHHGLYTILAARKVGPTGRVVAFEPSRRERRKLFLNLGLNGFTNVRVEHCALGRTDGEADFFLVDGAETGCNSLRPPNVDEPTRIVRVPVRTLDGRLRQRRIDHVDFIKMDAEGAELDILKGAVELLGRRPRPVILCEVYEIRTQPWGYAAKEVIEFLSCRGFHWFGILLDGGLENIDVKQEEFHGNFVAVPEERLEETHVRFETVLHRGGCVAWTGGVGK